MKRLTTFVAMSFVTLGLTTLLSLVLMTFGLHTSLAKPAATRPTETVKEEPVEAKIALSESLPPTGP